jgi:DNA-binding NtrC family response regulator
MSKVLIVDDEKNILKTLSIGLKRYQYDVMEALNGHEALDIMQKSPCDFVVSDIRMAPMDGYTLASRLHAQYPKVNVILISAYDFEDEKFKTKEIICYPKLTKPFSIPELVKALQREEKKEDKLKILVLGQKVDEKTIYKPLEEENFYITFYHCENEFCQHTQTDTYDLLVIDETRLDSDKWKLLNKIDKYAPQKPVILLTSRQGKNKFFEAPDLGIAVMDKTLFQTDREQAVSFFKKYINKTDPPETEYNYSESSSNNYLDIQEEADL